MKVKGRIRSTYSNLATSFRERKKNVKTSFRFNFLPFSPLFPSPPLPASWPAAFEFAVRTIDETLVSSHENPPLIPLSLSLKPSVERGE